MAQELAADNAAWATATPEQKAQMQATYQAQVSANQRASTASTLQTDESQVVADINANDFTAAWATAEGSTSLYGGGNANDAPTTDPLVAALESSQGLQALDPSKTWTAPEDAAYYQALGESGGYTGAGTLGKNPYGLWGSQAAVTGGQDAAANVAQEGATPDVERFAGAQPDKSFLSKYGTDIGLLVAAVAAPEAIPALSAAIGAGEGIVAGAEAGALYGAGTTAIADELGGNPITAKGELTGAVGGAVTGSIVESGLTGLPKVAASEGGKALTGALSSGLSSTPSQSTTSGLSPGVMPVTASGPPAMSNIGGDPSNPDLGTAAAGDATSSTDTSGFGSQFLTGLESTLGGTSLGNTLGSATPYLAIGALGQAQAAAGQASDAKYSQQLQALAQPSLGEETTLQNQYNSGKLNSTDQAVVNTGIAQGQSLIASAGGLSSIAQTLFQDYNTSTLKPADQTQLTQTVQAQKSAVAQQLASAGITDSTILAGQYQQIDNQALVTKQTILDGYYNVGNQAYTQWLTATEAGQQEITNAQTFASTQLQSYLTQSMNEAGIGIAASTTAIQTQMQTDAQYAAQVSQLYGTLMNAYAKQAAQKAASGGGSGGSTSIPGGLAGLTQSLTNTADTGITASSPDTSGIGNQDVTGLGALSNSPDVGALGDTLLGGGSDVTGTATIGDITDLGMLGGP